MANKMNEMKKMELVNKIRTSKNAKVYAESMGQLVEVGTEELLNSVYDGTIELDQLLNITDAIIDMTKCENPIQVMQKIYSAGSDVGTTTVKGQNAYMIDVTTDEGFEAFKRALVMLEDKDTHEPYTTVWQEGYNMFTFEFENGKHYVYYVVTNEEMEMLEQKIKAMSKDKMTKEDAAAVQADLPPFIRAWQESSIDVSKDKDKVFNYGIADFLNTIKVYSHQTKEFKDDIDFGYRTVKDAKRQGKKLPEFVYSNNARDAVNPVMDLMGHVTKALEDTAIEVLNDNIKTLYAQSTNKMYTQFVDDANISKELAYYIKRVYSICYAAVNEGKSMDAEEFKTMRNAIYTKAASLNVAKEDVVRIAIAAAMTTVGRHINDDNTETIVVKDADINRFRQYPVTNIFPDEYVAVVGDTVVYDTISADLLVRLDRDIEDNEEIYFINGTSEDGMIELAIDITGTLMELDGAFINVKDIYAYDEVDAFITDFTFVEGSTTASLKEFASNKKNNKVCDKGEFLLTKVKDLKALTVAGKNNNILVSNKEFLGTMIQTRDIAKNTTVNITNTISYRSANGYQNIFMFVVSR